jgi:hypothetical protein
MTLGGLMDALALVQPDMGVEFERGGAPGTFDSYRGYYDQLALGTSAVPVTTGELLDECRRANGATMTGYKGGDYLMGRDTWLNRAEYGACGSKIVGAKVSGGTLVLLEDADDDL